jgi:hypothetical protein
LLLQTVPELPGLKSSLNDVHLKIHHALKETSYLTDKANITGFGEMATTIGNYLPTRSRLGRMVLPPFPLASFWFSLADTEWRRSGGLFNAGRGLEGAHLDTTTIGWMEPLTLTTRYRTPGGGTGPTK